MGPREPPVVDEVQWKKDEGIEGPLYTYRFFMKCIIPAYLCVFCTSLFVFLLFPFLTALYASSTVFCSKGLLFYQYKFYMTRISLINSLLSHPCTSG